MKLDSKTEQDLTTAIDDINEAEKEINNILTGEITKDIFPAEELIIRLGLALSKLEALKVVAKDIADREISQSVLNIKKATPKITLSEAQSMAKLQFDGTIPLKIEVSIARAKRLKSLLVTMVEHLGY